MKTDVITVSSKGYRMETALKETEKVAAYKGLSAKSALHLRLLTEEMMGLMRSITGATEGLFWIEDEDGEYQLHLQVSTFLSSKEKEQLLAASSSGKNESSKGLMGRLRDFFDYGTDEDPSGFTSPLMLSDMFDYTGAPMFDMEWSMMQYENALYTRVEQNDTAAKEAWDELEKSVVKKVADDVKVFIRRGFAELVILKKLA